ncbi:flagellin a protein [Fulvimarina pelagi HTCC2506]|uniref:Flagellin n=1 Tax=Fulvimarina pelagi HTCC2506 TaxID=314231 RepID=Q0G160_9HYPH|nr:flagellin [Fulvimarina pelagi]EAU40779.1 flagellin a protein [Fulvimarina pelagi HTCC2506]
MTSLLTNVAAMTALQTLQNTNSMLEATQDRVSTGLRVSEARDNAAYWSIATTMRSDNKAMSAVKDSLGIGAAVVDTAYSAMDSAKDVLDEIKAKLTTAAQDGVDRSKVQDEISQLQNQLRSIAASASFSGQNWLSVDSSVAGYTSSKDIIASFSRSSSGALSLSSIKLDISAFTLFDSGTGKAGIIDSGRNTGAGTITAAAGTAAAGTAGPPPTSGSYVGALSATETMDADDIWTVNLRVDGGADQKVVITKANVDSALGTTDGVITAANYARVLANAAVSSGVQGVTINTTTGAIVSNSTGTASAVILGTGTTTINTDSVGVSEMDVTKAGLTSNDIKAYINIADAALRKVTAAASTLGSAKNRIDMQMTFVSNLMDTIDRGIGTLVDADMTEESTKMRALQTQQQLGVQALSIANNSSQSILQLFQN